MPPRSALDSWSCPHHQTMVRGGLGGSFHPKPFRSSMILHSQEDQEENTAPDRLGMFGVAV